MPDSPNPRNIDPLSDILSLLNVRSSMSASLAAGGEWAIRFQAHKGVKFNAVVEGSCWLVVDDLGEPLRLEAGDCFLVTDGRSFVLASDYDLPTVDAHDVFVDAVDGVARYGATPDFFAIGGRFTFDESDALFLLDILPPIIHVSGMSEPASVLQWVLKRLTEELSSARSGVRLMADHLAHIMLVQMLRVHAMSGGSVPSGWLKALSDERIGIAFRLIHDDPARRWKLDELAKAAGMSRSSFAFHFKALVGVAPLDYLLRWRMRLAAHALRNGDVSVSSVATSVGYESESAFSNTFKRVIGCAPRHYRHNTARPRYA
jgi:AraC-like DNA-binding protein